MFVKEKRNMVMHEELAGQFRSKILINFHQGFASWKTICHPRTQTCV
jgi:hypothetical protein